MSNTEPTLSPIEKPVPILSLGASGLFVADLYRALRERWPGLRFDICDHRGFGGMIESESDPIFGIKYSTHQCQFTRATLGGLIRAATGRLLYRRLCEAVFFGERPIARAVFGPSIRAARLRTDILDRYQYAICHFHFCTPATVTYAEVLPTHTRAIFSFWGSDLMRSPGAGAQYRVRRALQRASAITVQSPELREILLSIYGRELAPKTHLCRFPANREVFSHLAAITSQEDGTALARQRFGFAPDDCVIAVGNNGHSANQHESIIHGLSQLPQGLREKILLVFPFSYGGTDDYRCAVQQAATRAGFRHRLVQTHLAAEGVAALRAATDILVYAPVSDALSNTVLEAIYAGTHVAAGTWLPYGPFRRAGLPYTEIDCFSMLATRLPQLIATPRRTRTALLEIQSRIAAEFFAAATMPAWLDMYHTVLNQPANDG